MCAGGAPLTVATAKQKCEALAAKLGATITRGARGNEVCVEAPRGFVWPGGVHQLVNSPWDGEASVTVWRAAWKAMQGDLSPCEDDGCELCTIVE